MRMVDIVDIVANEFNKDLPIGLIQDNIRYILSSAPYHATVDDIKTAIAYLDVLRTLYGK